MVMAKRHLGKLPPRYKFILNRYEYERLSKCPLCKKQTHERKFALFVHIDEWGPMVMGKTCKYCSPCEMIIAHQHELESDMAYAFSRLAPEVIGNEYLVMGGLWRRKYGSAGWKATPALWTRC